MNPIRALIVRIRDWWWRRRHPGLRKLTSPEIAERRRRAKVIHDARFRWPPRGIRRALRHAEKGPSTRRGRKAHARIVRMAAKYGVVVRRS